MRPEALRRLSRLLLAAVLAQGGAAFADEWDEATDSDGGNGTDNALLHGSEQRHDLGARPGPANDEDWFLLQSHRLSSYQFVIDGMTGDLDFAAGDVQRIDGAGVLLGSAVPDGGVLSLSWLGGDEATTTSFLRVRGPGCGTDCTAADRYRARFYDTTYTMPRFNNSGTQTTLLLLQNVTDQSCTVRLAYLDSLGGSIDTSGSLLLSARQMRVVDTSAVAPGRAGSVRIPHLCGYGGLAGKAVSIEPGTGFTFDTPLLHEPR